MEIGKFFIKTKDNGLYHKVTLYEDMRVDVDTNSFFSHLKNQLSMLKKLLFGKIKTNNEKYQETLVEEILMLLYKHNEYLESHGMKPLNIEKSLKQMEKVNKPKKVKKKKTARQKKKLAEKRKQKLEWEKTPTYIG